MNEPADRARGRDGRTYPAQARDGAELRRVRGLVHALHCRDGLSLRATQEALQAYAVRRSLGQIHADLHQWACRLPRCPSAPQRPEPPQQQPAPERPGAAVHPAGIGLAGMVPRGS